MQQGGPLLPSTVWSTVANCFWLVSDQSFITVGIVLLYGPQDGRLHE